MKKKYGDGDGFDEYEGDEGGLKEMKLEEEDDGDTKKKKKKKIVNTGHNGDEDEDAKQKMKIETQTSGDCLADVEEEEEDEDEEEEEDYCSYFDEEYMKRMESERPSDDAGDEEWEKFLKKWYIGGASTRNLDPVDEKDEDCKRKQKQKEEYHEEDEEYCNQLDKQLYCGRKDPIDVADATPLFVRLSHLRRLGLNLGDFRQFVSECHCRKSFKIYDLPGDPRPGGFCHWYGDSISDQDTQPAKFALDEYRTRCNNASRLQLVKVEKISCFPDCDPWYYHTFTARDENTGEVKTYQAQVLEYGEHHQFILGLLRVKDPEKDHVLAVIELVEDEEGQSDADLVDSHEK